MHAELLPRIIAIEQSIERGDAYAAAAILRELNPKTIYSYNEVYDRLHSLEQKLAIVLFDGLSPAEFGQLIRDDNHLYTFHIWEGLESIADRVGVQDLWVIKDYLGFPSPDEYPKLYQTLARCEDDSLSKQLIETIDRLAAAEDDQGQSIVDHEKFMSMFRFIRWSPEDKGLSDCVRLLAERNDLLAQAAHQRYLQELPWGVDRKATLAMLQGLSATPELAIENKPLFLAALDEHKQPASLRTWLWGAIGETSANECLHGVISDLAAAENDTARQVYIEFLDACFEEIKERELPFAAQPLATQAEQLNTQPWSKITRGMYGTVLQKFLPTADANRVSNRYDRGTISLAKLWENLRLDHMGCLMPLLLMLGSGYLVDLALNWLWTSPEQLAWLPAVFFFGWIIWSLATMRTHFSGFETIGNKAVNCLVYFSLLLGALISAIAVRLV